MNDYLKNFQRFLHHITFFLFLIVIGFLLLFAASVFHESYPLWSRMLDHSGAAFLVVGSIGVYEKAVSEYFFLEHVSHLFNLNVSVRNSGLDKIYPDASEYTFDKELLAKSLSLRIVLNDGKRWLSNHSKIIEDRLKKKGFTTEVYLVNPDSPFLAVLANKTGDPEDRVKDKISRSIFDLKDWCNQAPQDGVLRVYYMPSFPTYTAFLGDTTAVVTLYAISHGKTNVPVITVRDNQSDESLFMFVKNDVDRLCDQSEIIFDSENE